MTNRTYRTNKAERDSALEAHQGIVYQFASRYRAAAFKCGLEYEDLIGAGWLGLCEAYERFDADRGVKFITFAVPYVRGHMQRAMRNSNGVISLPGRKYEAHEDFPIVLPLDCVTEPGADRMEDSILSRVEIDRIFARLYGPYREVLEGLYFDKKTLREVGDNLGRSITWVMNVRRRALRQMREMLTA